jgi:hypothetical protein
MLLFGFELASSWAGISPEAGILPRLGPRLAAARTSGSEALWWSVAAELLLGLLVIWVVAVLGQMEPPGHMQVGVSETALALAESSSSLRGLARGAAPGMCH